MKKILFLFFVLGTSIMNGCPTCIGYDHQRKLRRQAADILNCQCDCQKEYHTTPADNDKKGGYWCRVCQHRYFPSDPLFKSKKPDFLNKKTSEINNSIT